MPENNEHNNQFDLPNNSNNGIELPKVNTNGENKHSVNDFNANNSFNNNDSVNNNPFSNQNNSNLNEEEKKPIIEIPKAYYDKLAQEQQEKMEQENQLKQMKAETGEALNETGKFLSLALINGIIIFGLFYLTLNKFKYSLIGIPIYIVILTFYYAKKEGIKTSFPSALMFGGMMCSIVTFIMSMIQEEKGNIWMYYTIASISTAFLGMIISNIITKLITDIKNVKALQGIGYILFFAILIGAPFYLLKNYRDVIYRYLFFEQVAPVAETETDFVLKTLKNRYNVDFKCGIYAGTGEGESKDIIYDKFKSQIDQFDRKYTERVCRDKDGNDTIVQSKAYNEGEVKYIIIDDYMDVILLNKIKENIIKELKSITLAPTVRFYLYPEANCTFYGDCVDVSEYYERYNVETNIDEQWKVSTKLDYRQDLKMNHVDYLNKNKFKFVIDLVGNYGDGAIDYSGSIETILNRLNSIGYKNTFGYEITLLTSQSSLSLTTEKEVYKVRGTTNDEKVFKNPEVIPISGN